MALLDKYAALAAQYRQLEAAGANPFNVTFDEVVSPTEAIVGGRKTLLLGTNNYLGLTYDPAVVAAANAASSALGSGTTGSRIANGSYGGHGRLEAALADFYGRKHGMVFSTGYQANLGIISALAGKGDHLLLDADSHASIYDASRLGYAQVVFLGSRAGPHAAARNVFIAKREGGQVEVIFADLASPAVAGPNGQRSVHLSGAHVYEFDNGHPMQNQSLVAAGLNLDPDGSLPGAASYSPVAASTAHLLAASDAADIAERQWRFSTGLSTLLLALLGAALSRGRPRQSRYAKFGPAILAYSAYYLLCTTARTWVQHGQVGAFPGLWWAPAALALAMALLWYAPSLRRAWRATPRPHPASPPPLGWRPADSRDAA